MILSHSVAIWFCILALLAIQNADSQTTRKIAEERGVRALRPRFVKRETQAPLFRAPDEKIDDEYIVKLKDDLTDDQLAEFEEKFQQLSEEHGVHIDFQKNVTSLMKGFVARIPGDAVDILRWLDEVDFVEEDEQVHLATTWGLDRIDQVNLPLDNAYSSAPFGQGTGVNVFVVDTGIRFTHSEYDGRAYRFYDAHSDGYDGSDCDGHGSHVAGTIGGNTVGVAPDVHLFSCRVFDCNGTGSNSDIIGAMDDIAMFDLKPAVVSMSLSGGASNAMNLAVRRLIDVGYIVVVSAGNYNFDACNLSPASATEAITVGATDSSDGFSAFSNFGNCVNILAPGTDIYSASHEGDNSYKTDSGTSFAAPHVSGVVALLLEHDPTLTQDGVFKILMNSALSDKIDLSVNVPASQRPLTPNKFLQVPASFDNSLRIFYEAKTFDDAQAACEAIDMVLVKDTSAEKHAKIVEMVQNSGMGQMDFWLNGKEDSPGTWLTTDYIPFGTYQPWAAGEPNGNGECLQLVAGSGHNWGDVSCASTRPFICQVEFKFALSAFPEHRTFSNAQETCEIFGMNLVKDTSAIKHAAIIELLEEDGMGQSNVWVNGKEDSPGAWVTTDGVPLGHYQPWAWGEPNGVSGCLQLWAGAGHNWDDASCAATKAYVCEQEPPMKLYTAARVFKSAYVTCEANGMSLVKDTSADKHAAILALLQDNGINSDVWINGRITTGQDAFASTDGVPIGSYQPWEAGEPIYRFNSCIRLRAAEGFQWSEYWCDTPLPFICQPER